MFSKNIVETDMKYSRVLIIDILGLKIIIIGTITVKLSAVFQANFNNSIMQ